jgi:hypothetical protein
MTRRGMAVLASMSVVMFSACTGQSAPDTEAGTSSPNAVANQATTTSVPAGNTLASTTMPRALAAIFGSGHTNLWQVLTYLPGRLAYPAGHDDPLKQFGIDRSLSRGVAMITLLGRSAEVIDGGVDASMLQTMLERTGAPECRCTRRLPVPTTPPEPFSTT